MDLDPQLAPSTGTDVLGESRQKARGGGRGYFNEDPNIRDDFDDM